MSWFVFRFTQENRRTKARMCLGEKEEGRARIVRTKERCGKDGRVRVEHSSQLGRLRRRKVLGEDALPSQTPSPSPTPLSRIHLSPNPFLYFTDNNKERALGA